MFTIKVKHVMLNAWMPFYILYFAVPERV